MNSIGQRATVGFTFMNLVKENKNLMVCTADVSTSAGLDKFRKQYPFNFIDVGIAEQNLIGVATGLSVEGYDVITTTFAPFQTLRCCEQIKVNAGYMKNKLIMIGLASGLSLGTLGFTHCSIEDMGVLQSIPNIDILSPSDPLETALAIIQSIKSKNSTYIRLTGVANSKQINFSSKYFKISKAKYLREGNEIALISCGSIMSEVLNAALMVEKQINKKISVINFHTIKPLDEKLLSNIFKKYRAIVTIEEHNIFGGLGSQIAKFKTFFKEAPPQLIIGINDNYGKCGNYDEMKKIYNLDEVSLYKKILKFYEQTKL